LKPFTHDAGLRHGEPDPADDSKEAAFELGVGEDEGELVE
jgi:hypothetical protein